MLGGVRFPGPRIHVVLVDNAYWTILIAHHLGAQTSDSESGFFLLAQLYTVSHIYGERTRGDMIEKGKGIGHGGGVLSTLVDITDLFKVPASEA